MSKHIHIHTTALLRPKVKAKDESYFGTPDDFKRLMKSVWGLRVSFSQKPNLVEAKVSGKVVGNIQLNQNGKGWHGEYQKSLQNDSDAMPRVGQRVELVESVGGMTGKVVAVKNDYNVQVEYHDPKDGGMLRRWFTTASIKRTLDAKDESAETKARHEGKLSEATEKQISYAGSPKRADMPSGVFLKSSNKTYPVKKKVNGEWKYDKGLLLAAARRARMEGDESLANKADAIREKMEKNED